MINSISNKKIYTILVFTHILIGYLGSTVESVVGYLYFLLAVVLIFDVIIKRDSLSRAGFYALYIMGFEVTYRLTGASISYEGGKYLSIIILLAGIIFTRQKTNGWYYLLPLLLLLPSIFLSDNPDPIRIRKMILFNMSGPLTLVFSGMYFFQRRVSKEFFYKGLSFAFLPAFSLLTVLSVKASLSSLEFTSVSSSFDATGGFGPNQVSTVLGWFIFIVLLLRIQGKKTTPFIALDIVVVAYLLIRGLLTFSRGGILSVVFSIFFAVLYLIVKHRGMRLKFKRAMPFIISSLLFLFMVSYWANSMTNNYLLYRYQGKSTNEVRTGIEDSNKSLLTGRDDIMKGDFKAFLDYPFLGLGYGMASQYRAIYFGQEAAAHTEYSRLLSEHGLLGLLYMIIVFIIYPFVYNYKSSFLIDKYIFISVVLISMLTMFHAAMRLALPGVLYGLAFISVREESKFL